MGQIQPPSDKGRTDDTQRNPAGAGKRMAESDTQRAKPRQGGAGSSPQVPNVSPHEAPLRAHDEAEDIDDADDRDTAEFATDEGQNEGEGSRTAARKYNEGLRQNMAKGETEQKADEAKRAISGPEREELERAEQAGKRGQPRHSH